MNSTVFCSMLVVFLVFFSLSFDQVFSQSTTCDDSYECEGDTITTTYAYCYGYFGCDEADITSTYVYSYGAYAMYLADATASYVYNYGFRSGYYASIAVAYIYNYGFQAAMYADIEPYSSSLRAYMYGYYSGYYTDILCYDGDTCYVYCGSARGCYSLKFYCYSGATCYYDCSDDSDYCPTLYSGVESDVSAEEEILTNEHFSMLSDSKMDTYYAQNKDIKEKHSKIGGNEDLEKGFHNGEIDISLDLFNQAMKPVVMPTKFEKYSKKYGISVISALIGALCVIILLVSYNKFKNCKKNTMDAQYQPILA